MLKTGELDRRIDIQRSTVSRDSYGQQIATWSRIGRRRWAKYRPMLGNERFTADQYVAQEQIEFTVRWANDLSDLSPLDRIVFPGTFETPDSFTIYDIMAVHEIGRREGIRILATRRAETREQ